MIVPDFGGGFGGKHTGERRRGARLAKGRASRSASAGRARRSSPGPTSAPPPSSTPRPPSTPTASSPAGTSSTSTPAARPSTHPASPARRPAASCSRAAAARPAGRALAATASTLRPRVSWTNWPRRWGWTRCRSGRATSTTNAFARSSRRRQSSSTSSAVQDKAAGRRRRHRLRHREEPVRRHRRGRRGGTPAPLPSGGVHGVRVRQDPQPVEPAGPCSRCDPGKGPAMREEIRFENGRVTNAGFASYDASVRRRAAGARHTPDRPGSTCRRGAPARRR